LGRGVAIEVHSPELLQVQQSLRAEWLEWLSNQDRQSYRSHITIQNKVSPEAARNLYDQLSQEWIPFNGYGEGLLLWRYEGGPWTLIEEFPFTAEPEPDDRSDGSIYPNLT